MENILSILVVIFSGVISALIYTRASSRMKGKELEVKLKLEEKNKWVENINIAHKDYMDSTTEYLHGLMAYSFGAMNSAQITHKLSTSNKTHNSLIFYMYQSEYNLPLVEEVDVLMAEIADNFNKQRNIAVDYQREPKGRDVLHKKMNIFENHLRKNNYELSERLGKMVRKEKEKMTNEIIERK